MYNILIYLFLWAVAVVSLFDKKVKKLWRGEHAAFDLLREKVDKDAKYIWFHAASLGEFEQGRPLIEILRKEYPQYKVLLTFFSPSGYEVRKDYEHADIVCYLPIDTPVNARRFLSLVNPVAVFFIKYEFWYNYLHILKQKGIPVYSVSSIFRPGQIFFRWYAKRYAKVLRCFTHLFVQNEESKDLLSTIGITNVTISGDTRFDRVLQIRNNARKLPIVEAFKGSEKVFIAGSSWAPDEDIFIRYFNEHKGWKLVIAPHVIAEDHLKNIERKVIGGCIRYSKTVDEPKETIHALAEQSTLIIDCFGLLSSIYGYADVAYIGGGFGVGIHNTLEAAVWGIPVIFGPNNGKFMEAQGLKASGGGFEITSYEDFEQLMDTFTNNGKTITAAGNAAGEYVANRSGAISTILKECSINSDS